MALIHDIISTEQSGIVTPNSMLSKTEWPAQCSVVHSPQNDVLSPHMPTGLTINVTLLPERLRSAGYTTHMVGKWHLGNCAPEYVPQGRGFGTFLGFWAGQEDYFRHTVQDALDFFEDDRPLPELSGVYSGSVFTERAEHIIREHDASQPLFLYLPFPNPHAPLQVCTQCR